MKRILKIIFSRMILTILAILLQIAVSILLPYLLIEYTSVGFTYFYIPLDLIFRFAGVILILRIINTDMQIEGQLSWTVLVTVFPLGAIMIYFIFVRRRPPFMHRKYYIQANKEIKKYQVCYREEKTILKNGLKENFGQFEYIRTATGMKTFANTDVKFLYGGEVFLKELLSSLETAKKYIFMEYFIIERGEMWSPILEVLKRKVQEGVEVRLMYDDLGTNVRLPGNYCKKMNKLGIKCVKFNSFVPIMSALHNNRDHRKMTIIDGEIGFMGGINLADEYINVKQPFGHWKDSGVKLIGDAVDSMVLMFMQLFDVQNQEIEDFSKYLVEHTVDKRREGFVCPYGDGPKYFINDSVAEDVFLNMLGSAKNYFYATSPYLIIDNKLQNAFIRAARRGVDVRIITPRIPDKKSIFALTRSCYKPLQEAGVKIFEYTNGFIHAKQIVCDDELALVGTINFDYRSLLHHYECGVLMSQTASVMEIKHDFERLFSVSENMKDFKQSFWLRFWCAIIKIFTPML